MLALVCVRVGLCLFFITAWGANTNKRVTDALRTPSISGGGDLSVSKKHHLQPETDTILLQVSSSSVVVTEKTFSFLTEAKYAHCYQNDDYGQGQSCNSCWAFAVKNMVQARICKV